MLDHIGENLSTPNLDEFIRNWIQMFSRSPKTRLAWASQTGLSPPSYSTTKWWSKFEVIQQVHNTFRDVTTFLNTVDLAPTTIGKRESGGKTLKELQHLQYAKICMKPAYENRFDMSTGELKDLVLAACYFFPWQMSEIKPTATAIDCLKR